MNSKLAQFLEWGGGAAEAVAKEADDRPTRKYIRDQRFRMNLICAEAEN